MIAPSHQSERNKEVNSKLLTYTQVMQVSYTIPLSLSRTNAHTLLIKCSWVSKPLNESGWLCLQRLGLTFTSPSSSPCACVFLWVSGYKLSGLCHFVWNVTDLNEMVRQTRIWRRRRKRGRHRDDRPEEAGYSREQEDAKKGVDKE